MVPGDSGRARKGLNSQPNCIPKLHSSRARLDGKAPQVLRCQIRSSSRRTPVDPAFFHLGSAQGQAGSTRSQCRKGGAVESDGELWLQGGQSSSSSGLAFQLRLCVCCRFPPLLMNPRASWSDLQDLGSSLQKRQSATTESMAFHSGSCLAFLPSLWACSQRFLSLPRAWAVHQNATLPRRGWPTSDHERVLPQRAR